MLRLSARSVRASLVALWVRRIRKLHRFRRLQRIWGHLGLFLRDIGLWAEFRGRLLVASAGSSSRARSGCKPKGAGGAPAAAAAANAPALVGVKEPDAEMAVAEAAGTWRNERSSQKRALSERKEKEGRKAAKEMPKKT